MSRDFTKFPDDEHGDQLWELHRAGEDLFARRSVTFSLLFEKEVDAQATGLQLCKAGYLVQVDECLGTFDVEAWEVAVTDEIVPTHERISGISALITRVGAERSGQFDGWTEGPVVEGEQTSDQPSVALPSTRTISSPQRTFETAVMLLWGISIALCGLGWVELFGPISVALFGLLAICDTIFRKNGFGPLVAGMLTGAMIWGGIQVHDREKATLAYLAHRDAIGCEAYDHWRRDRRQSDFAGAAPSDQDVKRCEGDYETPDFHALLKVKGW